MKVLFLSNERLLPLSGGGSVGNLKIVGKMVERGHDVTVATPMYLGVEELRRIEVEHNIRLKPFSPYYIHRNISLRGPKYILYSVLFTFHILRLLLAERYDVLFVRNCLIGAPALLFKPFVKSLYAISLTDFLTGFLHEHGLYPSPVVDLLFWLERKVPCGFDQVFVITPEMKRILSEAGCHPSKIVVSYDGVETSVFNPDAVSDEEVGSIRESFGVEQKLVLFHGAILFTDEKAMQGLREAIKRTVERSDDITFVLIGHGKKYDVIKAEMGSDRVRFPGYIEHDLLPKYIRAADVGIIPYKRNFNNDIIITLKLLEYLSMGLPVVSTRLKSIAELFGGYDFVRITDTPEEFAAAVVEVSEHGKSGDAVNLIRDRFSWDHVTEHIVSSVEDSLGSGG